MRKSATAMPPVRVDTLYTRFVGRDSAIAEEAESAKIIAKIAEEQRSRKAKNRRAALRAAGSRAAPGASPITMSAGLVPGAALGAGAGPSGRRPPVPLRSSRLRDLCEK